jgi:hypothetical protein
VVEVPSASRVKAGVKTASEAGVEAGVETKGAVGLRVECLALPCCLVLFFGRPQLIITAVLPKKVQFILAFDQITPGINDGPCHLELLCLWSKRPSTRCVLRTLTEAPIDPVQPLVP